MALCLAGYVFSLLINAQPNDVMDRKDIIIEGFNNYKLILPILSDSLTPSLIIWSIIGVIANYSRANYYETSKIKPAFAIPIFILNIIWYITYMALKTFFFEVVIINLVVFYGVLIVSLLFFNEYDVREEG